MSSPGLTGRSSIPETAVLEPIGRGVLDHPPSRVMTTESVARISKHSSAFSRRDRARVSDVAHPRQLRGRREGRVPAAPAAPVHKKSTGKEPQVKAETSGLPCAVVYGLLRALPGNRAFLLPSPASLVTPRTWPQRREARTTRLDRPHRCRS